MPLHAVEGLHLTREEIEALAREFRNSYLDPNRKPTLYQLVAKIDIWLLTHQPERTA